MNPIPRQVRDPGRTDGLLLLSDITAAPDPHVHYRQLRARYGNVAPVALEPGVPAWLVMGYRELLTLVRQEHVFSRDARNWADYRSRIVPADSPLGPMMFPRDNVIGADGAEHRRLRAPLDHAVAGIDLRAMRRAVKDVCDGLIDGFAARGRADLVTEYAQAVPLLALAGQFGLHGAAGHELLAALAALFGSGTDSQAGNRSFEEILRSVRDQRTHRPGDDLTTALATHPALRTPDEVLQSMVVMISAGQETTTIWIARTLARMLTDDRFAAQLRGGRLGIDDALDAVLQDEPPMTHMPARYALADTELGGRPIAAGEVLILGLAATGTDPAVHTGTPSPGSRAHLAWSAGPHGCPARVPARLIAHTAVETVLRRLPGIHLTEDTTAISYRPSPWTRFLSQLPVRFPPNPGA
ncbi:cytochrome P450 [Streptomyces sp. MS19]|uniref:cytochrome P450 n=1 Tax=Streptomyces sp. MS19 TaxID=3385972 RepID=UPI0039A2981D